MARPFSQFTLQHLKAIENLISSSIVMPPFGSVRVDLVQNLGVIEYKMASSLKELLKMDFNKPTHTINIDNNFNIVFTGFNQQTQTLLTSIINNYLQIHGFI